MTTLTLLGTKPESDTVTTFQFTKSGLTWRAGQYAGFVIPEVSPILEQYEHWFTISSAPYQESLDISVRRSRSPFKSALWDLRPGDSIQAHTVDGDFDWPEASRFPIFIAGGIGITPFISMLRQRLHQQLTLAAELYFFHRPDDQIPFLSELNSLVAHHPDLQVHFLDQKPLSLQPITAIKALPDNAEVLMAGPVPMIDRLSQELKPTGLPVKVDWYFGYGINNF